MRESPLVHAGDPPIDDRCVRFLDRATAIRDRHMNAAVLDLGSAALEELCGGSWVRASDRSAARDETLSALVERHGERLDWLDLSIDPIRTALRAYRVDRQLPPVSKGKLLPVSLRALAGVAEREAMVRLANQAATERWTTQQTLDAVAAWREQAGVRSKGGRPPLPGAVKAVRKIVKASVVSKPDDVAALGEAERAEVRAKRITMQTQVAACLAAIAG